MERVIDRTAYRRNTCTTRNTNKKDIKKILKKIKKFLYQLLGSSLIFLIILIIKIYNVEPLLTWINENINKQISVEETYKYAQSKLLEFKEYLNKIESSYMPNDESKEILQEDSSVISDENDDEIVVQNKVYEEAVEGVNQMIDDAEYIKEKYKLKHAVQGTVTSIFGVRESDNKIVTAYHSGIDVAANKGTNIYASIGGEVIVAGTDNAYGKYVMIQTDNMVTVYAHCSELKVKKGQKVKQGEIIAKVGSTGWSTGPHLHFEIRLDDRFVNPADVLDYSKMRSE